MPTTKIKKKIDVIFYIFVRIERRGKKMTNNAMPSASF